MGGSFKAKQTTWASEKSRSHLSISKPQREGGLQATVMAADMREDRGTHDLTWYVLSKLSYMNRVIRDVLPTVKQ